MITCLFESKGFPCRWIYSKIPWEEVGKKGEFEKVVIFIYHFPLVSLIRLRVMSVEVTRHCIWLVSCRYSVVV